MDDLIDDYFGLTDNNEIIMDNVDIEEENELNLESNGIEDDDLENANEKNTIVLGIDLGTTNTCIGIWRNNNYEIIPDSYGNRTIPSYVSFTKRSKYVGKEAKNQVELNPENTIYEVKRLIGRKSNDQTVINDKEFLSYNVINDEDENILVQTDVEYGGKNEFTPEEISSMILIEAKFMAESYLRMPVTKAVITVPAYFTDSQRQATKDAGIIAGLEVLRIISEPTAAALAYGMERVEKDDDLNILVYDLGGGTLDASIVNISDGMFRVLASTGNTHLGGADFDNKIIEYCMNRFKRKHGIQKLNDLSSLSYQKLRKSCEEAKKLLSFTHEAIIAVKDFYDGKNLLIKLERKDFENLCRPLFLLCLHLVEEVLASANLEREHIDEVILVGGATRMPIIKDNLKLFFKGMEPNSSINPDEVVAVGAALQGFILANSNDPFSENVVLLDIIPLSLGVETIGGIMTTLIPRNSVIPIKRKKKFTTDTDNESSILVKVFEGERKMTKDNFFVGEFLLEGLEEAPRGVVKIDITFSVDINGIISVTAEDTDNTNNKKTVTIKSNKGRLSPERIKELVIEAREMEIKDKIEREKRQSFYEIEDLCSNIETNINNKDFKIKDADKEKVKLDISQIKDWLKEKNYLDRTEREYEKVIKKIKKKYGTLMLRVTNENSGVKGTGDDKGEMQKTNIYDDDDDEQIFEKIENEELGLNEIANDEQRKELIQLRSSLKQMCYDIFEILNTADLNCDQSEIRELKEFIDDTLLQLYIKEKMSCAEYKSKIDEINKICEDFFNKGDIFEKVDEVKFKKNELQQLCYAIISCIMSNMYSFSNKDQTDNIKKLCEENLDWLDDIEIAIKKAELENDTFTEPSENEYQERIDAINKLCSLIHDSMLDVNIEDDIDVDEDDVGEEEKEELEKITDFFKDINNEPFDDYMDNMGTTLSSLQDQQCD